MSKLGLLTALAAMSSMHMEEDYGILPTESKSKSYGGRKVPAVKGKRSRSLRTRSNRRKAS